MRVAVFSDVHGNLPALEKFVELTRDEADTYLCLGDVVNYGPWSEECLELTLSLPGITLLEGNHERIFLGTEALDDQLPLVREFTNHARPTFKSYDRIRGLPQSVELAGWLCVHTVGGMRVYSDTHLEVEQDTILGHTHHAFRIERGAYTIVNTGSVGQNRRDLSRLNYAWLETSTAAVTLCEAEYPVAILLDEMTARGYSERCLDYYRHKLPP